MEKTRDVDCSCGHAGRQANRRSIASSAIKIPSRIHHRMNTRKLRLSFALLTLFVGGILAGCFATVTKSPDVSDNIRKSLDQAGLKDVSVSQDRDKGVVTLGGQVAREDDKSQAESLAKSLAGTQVVANQIAVIPIGAEKEAKTVNSDLGHRHREESGRCIDPKQVARQREIRSEERRRHADRRSKLAVQARLRRNGSHESAKREAGRE
jgi:hyperosmotically inducible protein